MVKVISFAACIVLLIQLISISATTTPIIPLQSESVQPSVRTAGNELPIQITNDPFYQSTSSGGIVSEAITNEDTKQPISSTLYDVTLPVGNYSPTTYRTLTTNLMDYSTTLGAAIIQSSSTNDESQTTSTTTSSTQGSNGSTPSLNLDEDCPTLVNADSLSQTQLVERLTAPCRYDRLERPITYSKKGERLPVDVNSRVYVYFMQNLETDTLQFKLHALFQLRYVDPRLAFEEVSPNRKQPIWGEMPLRDTIWVPHIFFANERDSSILGTAVKDVLTSVSPNGTVIISTRIQATLNCWMDLQKFPFDEQYCSTIMESWMYNTSELVLHWEDNSAVTFDPNLHLTEYVFLGSWSNETVVNADLNDLRHGAFAGNYSSLSFTVHLSREVGSYIMSYFLPSMIIVAISWVSFWLQADQTPARTTLGTTTMLAFITLASSQGQTLPKVSYIKLSEIWFVGCTLFIFGSLVEFAFANTIWRRKKNVELKKMKSKYILKSTFVPRMARKDMERRKSRSFSSLNEKSENSNTETNTYNNYLTIDAVPIVTTKFKKEFVPGSPNQNVDVEKSCNNNLSKSDSIINVDNFNDSNNSNESINQSWTIMTPQEISLWIDRRARFIFPLAFLVFNALFWALVYGL